MTLNVTGADTQKGNLAKLYISNLDTQGNNKPGRIKIYDNETLIDTVYIDNTPQLVIIEYLIKWTVGVQQQLVGIILYDMQTVDGYIYVFKDNVQIGSAEIIRGRFEFYYTPETSRDHTLEFRYNGSGDVGSATTTYEVTNIQLNEIELDCTTSTDDWLPCLTTPAIKTLDGSSCVMIQCNVYDWTLAGYIFEITKTYTLHTELHLNNRSNGYIRLGFIDNYDTLDVNNAHIIEYTNENGFRWNKVTRANGNDTLVSTALQGKQIKYNAWTDVDFLIDEGEIYASYTTSSGEIITDEYVGTMDYDFCFTMSSWINRTNGMGCRKFVVTEL